MRTLVYFASGNYKAAYQNLEFDRIFLIDNHHRNPYPINIGERERIINEPIITDSRGRAYDRRERYASFNEKPRLGDFDLTIFLDYKVQRVDADRSVYGWDIVKSNPVNRKIYKRGKVYCLEMDCLEAIEYLKQEKISINCFVCLNEGLGEGGGYYPINVDKFMERINPLLENNYIHLMKKEYYDRYKEYSFDFMNNLKEIDSTNINYIDPSIFSDYSFMQNAQVYQHI